MSDVHEDPSANTARFKAFVNEAPEQEKRGLPIALIATIAVAAVAVIAVIAFLATR